MAEFCKQCSIDIFGRDFGDFAGLVTAEDVAQGYGMDVLCEGCVSAWVDHEGTCKSTHCEHKHGVAAKIIETAKEK